MTVTRAKTRKGTPPAGFYVTATTSQKVYVAAAASFARYVGSVLVATEVKGELWVITPRGNGFQQFLGILDGGRISVAAMGVGLAQGAYDLAYAYAQQRQQFGQPISKFQAIQFRLADMATEIEAGRGLVYKAAWLKDQGRDFALAAAQAKLYTGELSNRAVNWALQIHGGYGYMAEYAISRFYRDQKILEIGEGTNEVQRMVIAKHLGL